MRYRVLLGTMVVILSSLLGCGTHVVEITIPTATVATAPQSLTAIRLGDVTFEPDDVRHVSVEFSWQGLSEIAPIESTYYLTRTTDAFTATAFFQLARWSNPLTDTVDFAIEVRDVRLFLADLARSDMRKGTYKPSKPNTDDYPSYLITIATTNDVITLYSRSQGEYNVPWGMTTNGKQDFSISTNHPKKALDELMRFFPTERLETLMDRAWKR